MAAQIFSRCPCLGTWKRLLTVAQQQGVGLGVTFLDGTSARAHGKAAGAAKKGATVQERAALGRSYGHFGTKVCVIADSAGRTNAFFLAPGQAYECPLPHPCWPDCRACRCG